MGARKSFRERVFQTVVFEALAIALSTMVFAWVMHTGWRDMGVVALVNSLAATIWTFLYNGAYDRLHARHGFRKSVPIRILHAAGFELGLTIFTLPFLMWWLGLGILPALILETGGIVMFFFYTYAFHRGYDTLRAHWRPAGETPLSSNL